MATSLNGKYAITCSFCFKTNFLEGLGHNVNIEYWNIKLCPILESFLNLGNEIYKRELVKFIPFYAYLGIEYKQNALLNSLIDNILYLKPQLHIKGRDDIMSEFYRFHDAFNQYIDNFIERRLVHEEFNTFNWIFLLLFLSMDYCNNNCTQN